MIPRRARLAVLLAFALHGFLILAGQYRFSFDAYIHMFFADHYRMDWWTLWEPRWYTGFSVASYPPLVHQLIGLLSPLAGLDAAFAIVLWATLSAYPLGVYAFSRAFVGRTAAGYAALGAALVSSVFLSAHAFGQLPSLVATLFALFAVAALAEFLRCGGRLNFALAVALFAVVMAAHHATLLFLPWAIAGLVVHLLTHEKTSRRMLFSRLAVFLPVAALVGLMVIWPFWAWGHGQSIQTPIDHPSRHNFLTDSFAVVAFFLPMYGPLMALIPFALWIAYSQRRYRGLGLATFLPLFLLGLGDTTPLPRILFRAGWEWLTYDRFAFWASLTLLPFFGVALLWARYKLPKYFGLRIQRFPSFRIKIRNPDSWPPMPLGRPRRWGTALVLLFMGLIALFVGMLSTLMPFEPARIDMQPIVRFLAKDDRAQWRYLTFGFGDQLAYLSTLTKATTMDGSYHTARSLPELRESGIAQIDTAYWFPNGMRALDPILQKSGEHGVRWGFVSLATYIPVLKRNGWVRLTTLDNGIQVWENPSAVLPIPAQTPAEDPFETFSWGVFPLSSLALASLLAALRFRPAMTRKILLGIHQLALGLLPLGLCFWYFAPIVKMPVDGVYFTYTDALLFASDALALLAVFSWLFPHLFSSPKVHALWTLGKAGWGSWALCLLASLSIFWSVDWQISLYFSLHLWLVFGLFLSVRDRPEVWRSVAIGFCVALGLQILVGFGEFFAQSTAFLSPLGLNWPGNLTPAMQGVSVVQLPDGLRWLRTYGTLPHPNVLGGFALAFLLGPAAFFLLEGRRRVWAALLFAGGIALLVLTFSRSAWVGLALAGVMLVLHHRKFERRQLMLLALVGLTGLLLAAAPLYPLVFTRAGTSAVPTEAFSNEARAWLIQSTLNIIKDHPWLGVGVGAYVVEYARHAPYGYLIEPVHNLPLLVVAELGLGGALVVIGLGVVVVTGAWRAKHPETALFAAALIGLLTTGLFDHYLWTLAPGRLLLGLLFGLLAAQMREDRDRQDQKR